MRDDGYFDELVASDYEKSSAEMFAPGELIPTVDFLAGLAGAGRALEFGIGTGRVALPLAARGVAVHGIDLSEPMVARMRASPGGGDIDVTIGDFSSARVGGYFELVYLVYNTIMNLGTQERQTACFQNAALHLAAGGRFVIETMVPDLQRLPPGERFRPFRVDVERIGFDEYEVADQRLVSHHLKRVDGEWQRRSLPFRYVWPSELDLMARIAGLVPDGRWSGWKGEPFVSESRRLVASWRKPD